MTVLTNLPSNSINTLDIDKDTNIVTIQWKSSDRYYYYRVENLTEFEESVMNNIPYSQDPEEDDKSLGRFINQSIADGVLIQLSEVTPDNILLLNEDADVYND